MHHITTSKLIVLCAAVMEHAVTAPPLNLSTTKVTVSSATNKPSITITNGLNKLTVNCKQVSLPVDNVNPQHLKVGFTVGPVNISCNEINIACNNVCDSKIQVVSRRDSLSEHALSLVSQKMPIEETESYLSGIPHYIDGIVVEEDEEGEEEEEEEEEGDVVSEDEETVKQNPVKAEPNLSSDGYSCDKCDETFSRVTQLRVHIRMHHSTKEKVR